MSLKTCLTCDEKIPLEPIYKKQCLFCYQNNYKVCYNCKKQKPNSYLLCFDCNKLDKVDRIDRYVHTIEWSYNKSGICKHCKYENTYKGQKYCLTCYTCHYS